RSDDTGGRGSELSMQAKAEITRRYAEAPSGVEEETGRLQVVVGKDWSRDNARASAHEGRCGAVANGEQGPQAAATEALRWHDEGVPTRTSLRCRGHARVPRGRHRRAMRPTMRAHLPYVEPHRH